MAVEEWINDGAPLHVMRDNPGHNLPMPAGMWGGRRARGDEAARNCSLDDMAQLFAEWDAARARQHTKRPVREMDQDFLREAVWPRMNATATQHDAFYCRQFKGSKPFPTKRIDTPVLQFVGQVSRHPEVNI